MDSHGITSTKPRLFTSPTPASLDLGPCELVGVSLAGCRTSLYIPELKLCFDAGFPFPYQLSAEHFFITHGHLDHAAAIPYLISQKNLNNQKLARFYMPPELVAPLGQIIQLWQSIERHNYQFDFRPIEANVEVELNQQFFVKAFKAHHRVPARGYTLFQRRKHLKAEFLGLAKPELVTLKAKGTPVDEVTDTPLMSFSGDSQLEFLWEHDWITQSKYLLIETTYLDERRSRAQAREWGHIHLDELIEVLPQIQSEKIVLMHISSRYGDHEAQKIIEQKIPAADKERVMFFPGR
jgi:ribonuclease Z